MATCPQCGVSVGATQRLCRACGCDLERARSAGGLLRRFLRWLSGPLRVRLGMPRVTFAVRLGSAPDETAPDDAADLAALPAELREPLVKAGGGDPGVQTSEHVTAAGPMKITTRTVTRTYHSLDELPPELRQRVAEAVAKGGSSVSSAITVDINGVRRTFNRIEDVPEPYRQSIEEARRGAGKR